MKIGAKFFVFVAVLMLSCLRFAFAEGFSDAFDLLSANSPRGADALGIGNATTAALDYSSDNPAILASYAESLEVASITATAGGILFSAAPSVIFHSEALTYKLPVGVLQFFHSDAETNREIAQGIGLDIQLHSAPVFNLMYGVRAAENLFRQGDFLDLGISFSPPVGATSLAMYVPQSEGLSQTRSRNLGFGVGLLYSPVKGIAIGSSYNESRSSIYERDLISGHSTKSHSIVRQGRFGVGVQAMEKLFFTVEYQVNQTGSGYQQHQVAGGVEYCIVESICGYVGYNGSGPTGGVGIYGKHVSLNVSYANSLSKATDLYLGRSPTVMMSVNVAW